MAKARYFKLGQTAVSFYCPVTKLKIATGNAGSFEGEASTKVKNALRHGHIIEIKEDEAKEMGTISAAPAKPAESNDESKSFEDMTKAELTEFYKSNYEDLTEEDISSFEDMKKAEMVEFLSE